MFYRFVNVTNLRREYVDFIGSSLLITVATALARGLGFVFPIVLIWMYDVQEYGFIRYVIATAWAVGEMMSGGYPVTMTRFLGKTKDEAEHQVLITNSFIATITFLILSSILLFIGLVIFQRLYWEIFVVVIGITIDRFYFALVRGLQRTDALVIYRIGANFGQLLLVLILFSMGFYPSWLIILVYSFIYLLPISLIQLWRPINNKLNRHLLSCLKIRQLTSFAVMIMIGTGGYGLANYIDVFVLERFSSLSEVGIYTTGKTIAILYVMLPFGIITVLMPRVAGFTNRSRMAKYVGFSLIITLGSSLVLFMLMLIFGPRLLELIMPPSYADVWQVLPVLSLAAIALSVGMVMLSALVGMGKPYVSAIAYFFIVIIGLGLLYFFVPRWGMLGAAWASFAYFVILIVIVSPIMINSLRSPTIFSRKSV